MRVRSYKDLDCWKNAIELVAIVDPFVDRFARARRFALADQLARAALSVSSNIAEGNGRVHRAEYAHHVSISRASLNEVESILYVAIRTGCVQQHECAEAFVLIEVISRQLTNLLRALYTKTDRLRTMTNGDSGQGTRD